MFQRLFSPMYIYQSKNVRHLRAAYLLGLSQPVLVNWQIIVLSCFVRPRIVNMAAFCQYPLLVVYSYLVSALLCSVARSYSHFAIE